MSGSGSGSGSKSRTLAQSSDSVWGSQSPYLTDLYSQASSEAARGQNEADMARQAYGDMGGQIGGLYSQASEGYGSSMRPYQQAGQEAASTLQNVMSQDPVNNPYLQQNVQNAMGAVSDNFQRNIMPAIGAGAQASGQYGSSRHGIAQGLAMSDANSQASSLANQMYGQAYDQGLANKLNATQQAGNLMGQGTQSALGQVQGYGDLANLGLLQGGAYQQAGQAGFAPISQYAGIVGGPTTLSQSTSSSKAKAYGGSTGGGM